MALGAVVSAEFVQMPVRKPELFKGRPWVVYYEGAVHESGKRSKRGMASFETRREAARFAFRICPTINEDDLPF